MSLWLFGMQVWYRCEEWAWGIGDLELPGEAVHQVAMDGSELGVVADETVELAARDLAVAAGGAAPVEHAAHDATGVGVLHIGAERRIDARAVPADAEDPVGGVVGEEHVGDLGDEVGIGELAQVRGDE